MRRLDDLFRFFPCIYLYMVFFHLDFRRGKAVPAVYFIRKLFPAVFSKFIFQFLIRHGMFHHNYRQPVQVFFPFAVLFLRLSAGNAFRFFLCVFLRGNSFGFVKKYDLPIHFHKRHLVFGFMFL